MRQKIALALIALWLVLEHPVFSQTKTAPLTGPESDAAVNKWANEMFNHPGLGHFTGNHRKELQRDGSYIIWGEFVGRDGVTTAWVVESRIPAPPVKI